MDVVVDPDGVGLPGLLDGPEESAVIVFAHGSGSSRLSPRNQLVAAALNGAGFATLLFDLLTPNEAADRSNVFDIVLLADRVDAAVRWLGTSRAIGLFGASTGAAAAIVAASRPGSPVGAVVSRGGRPDLAGDALGVAIAPTQLIVGSRDEQVLELNRTAMERMPGPVELAVVAGATHLFEEPGTLDEVSDLAAGFFAAHLAS
ncbi:MAG: hypothetical protein KJP12_02995 [Acidimicrobiia bacterium]|nr:hypothetical protein [Acidimicrobiia bacterium]NNF68986.1 hypothetical protein [Acidimicrobiia bacterium]NNK92372.1 hypothetical protein [Acidimicrobiia bacterium]